MITVQKSSLESPDDAGASVSPSVGDVIDLGGVTAKVVADGGKTVDLDIETVNGQPTVDAGAGQDESGDDESAMPDSSSNAGQDKERLALLAAVRSADARR